MIDAVKKRVKDMNVSNKIKCVIRNAKKLPKIVRFFWIWNLYWKKEATYA